MFESRIVYFFFRLDHSQLAPFVIGFKSGSGTLQVVKRRITGRQVNNISNEPIARESETFSVLGCGTGMMDSASNFDLLGKWVLKVQVSFTA